MTIFEIDGSSFSWTLPYRPPQVDLQPRPRPCWVSQISSTETTVKVNLGTRDDECQLVLRCYWGVKVKAFHHILRSPWNWFSEALLCSEGNLFGSAGCILPGKQFPHSFLKTWGKSKPSNLDQDSGKKAT